MRWLDGARSGSGHVPLAFGADYCILVDILLAERTYLSIAGAKERKQNPEWPEKHTDYKGTASLALLIADHCSGNAAE